MDKVRMPAEALRDLISRALQANGCDAANAAAISANMTRAQRDGSRSHGLFRLEGHVTSLRNGKVNGVAAPRAERLTPALVRVDADRGYAPGAHELGLPMLAEAARECGVAALAITNVFHFAALWPEVEVLAEQGLPALAVTSSPPYAAPAGGARPLYGTNPMAFGWPRPGKPPMVFDQASAAMARGEIMVAMRAGHQVPEGVGVDAEGRPTTDPKAILEGGAQLCFGGYKGSSIAMLVDLLAGPLMAQPLSYEAGETDNGDGGAALGGELILAFAPERFGAADAAEHGERLFAKLLEIEGARLPGDSRIAAREDSDREGVVVDRAMVERAEALARGEP